ncbi:MAG: TraX family protein [Eubacteriales bacterium]|nr:TraX family protein [Eubacteriales bacterium]
MSTMMGRRGVVWKTPTVTAIGLKNFACAMMLLQSIGIAVIQNGIIHVEQYTQESLWNTLGENGTLMTLTGVSQVLQLLGGLSVPIFAFLLVEGFRNTSDYKKYLLTMAAFAVVSEIPYDLAMSVKWIDFTGQNGLFTMVICLLMLYFLDMLKDKPGVSIKVLKALIVVCAAAWAMVLRTAYGGGMVALTAVFYLLYEKNVAKTVLGVIISLLYVTAPLAFYGIWCYNGQRKDKVSKYVYYAFYPLHLLVLGLIVKIFMA